MREVVEQAIEAARDTARAESPALITCPACRGRGVVPLAPHEARAADRAASVSTMLAEIRRQRARAS